MRAVDRIRTLFFTNKASEQIFIFLQKIPGFYTLSFKFLAGNHLYPKNTIRNVERKGIKYQLDIHDYQEWLIYTNAEADSSKEIINFLNHSKVVFDIGANIGQTSLWIDQYLKKKGYDYHIYAFEPHPTTFKKLVTNLTLNPHAKINPINIGLGNTSSELELVEDCETNSGGFRIGKVTPTQKGVKIPVSTIDEFVREHKIESIDFIKIDVEGFEYHVLQGAKKTLEVHKPDLLVEFCPDNLEKQGSKVIELLNFLSSLSYSIYDIKSSKKDAELIEFHGMTDISCISFGNV